MAKPSPEFRLFAWDGISFETQSDWDLAFQESRLGITRIRMEDPAAVRLSAEWTEPAPHADLGRIMARFQANSQQLLKAAKNSETLKGLPSGWSAILYRFPDDRRLGLAFYLSEQKDLFGFFQLHGDAIGSGEAEGLLRRFIASFQRHTSGPIPWACYDVAFTVPEGFRLSEAAFHPGLKRFSFGRSMRRLHVWHVSLADRVLKRSQTDALTWAADFLNKSGLVKGPMFEAKAGALIAMRPLFPSRWHFSELARFCFRYRAEVRHGLESNRLILVCFQYRFDSDLAWLAGMDLAISL